LFYSKEHKEHDVFWIPTPLLVEVQNAQLNRTLAGRVLWQLNLCQQSEPPAKARFCPAFFISSVLTCLLIFLQFLNTPQDIMNIPVPEEDNNRGVAPDAIINAFGALTRFRNENPQADESLRTLGRFHGVIAGLHRDLGSRGVAQFNDFLRSAQLRPIPVPDVQEDMAQVAEEDGDNNISEYDHAYTIIRPFPIHSVTNFKKQEDDPKINVEIEVTLDCDSSFLASSSLENIVFRLVKDKTATLGMRSLINRMESNSSTRFGVLSSGNFRVNAFHRNSPISGEVGMQRFSNILLGQIIVGELTHSVSIYLVEVNGISSTNFFTSMQVQVVVSALNAIRYNYGSFDSLFRILPEDKDRRTYIHKITALPLFGIRVEGKGEKSDPVNSNFTLHGDFVRVYLASMWEAIVNMAMSEDKWKCQYNHPNISNKQNFIQAHHLQEAASHLRSHAVFEAKAAGIKEKFPLTVGPKTFQAQDDKGLGKWIIASVPQLKEALLKFFCTAELPEKRDLNGGDITVVQGMDIGLMMWPTRAGKNLVVNGAIGKKYLSKLLLQEKKTAPDYGRSLSTPISLYQCSTSHIAFVALSITASQFDELVDFSPHEIAEVSGDWEVAQRAAMDRSIDNDSEGETPI
jgi:hypothetical protein